MSSFSLVLLEGISLLCTSYKILSNILLSRMKINDKNYVKKKERERHLHGCWQKTLPEYGDRDERVDKVCSFQLALQPSSAEEEIKF